MATSRISICKSFIVHVLRLSYHGGTSKIFAYILTLCGQPIVDQVK